MACKTCIKDKYFQILRIHYWHHQKHLIKEFANNMETGLLRMMDIMNEQCPECRKEKA